MVEKQPKEVNKNGSASTEWGFLFLVGLMVVAVVGGLGYVLFQKIGK